MPAIDNDALVVAAVSKVFWQQRTVRKARKWSNHAVTLQKELGDAWAAYYK